MEKNEREKYKRKIAIYEKLGAVKFQKIVFGIERAKFKVIKKLIPNFPKYYDKYKDFLTKSSLKKAKSEIEADKIISDAYFSKTAMKKELIKEMNRNYHIDSKKPTEVYNYLKWNKEVHTNGLIKNIIAIPITIVAAILGIPGAIPFLIIEIIRAGINFECINIQNYNICRYKIVEDKLKRIEEKKINKNIEEYSKADAVIGKSIEKKANIPSIDDIINNIKTPEELEQLKKRLKRGLYEYRNINNDNNKIYENKKMRGSI